MRNFIAFACAAAAQAFAETLIMPPSATATGDDVAIVWIHGASCKIEAYQDLASKVQVQAEADGKRVFVGLPQFILDTPEPILIDSYVKETLEKLTEAGFTGDNIFIAGHSLGGVMAQDYAKKNTDIIKGQFLMGSVLLRDKHELNADGSTHWNYDVPTLTMGGTKDGLMRVSRLAEAWWHQTENIEAAQAGMFPIYAQEGTAHMTYMTGEAPSSVKKRDLKPDMDDTTAKNNFAGAMVKFIDNVLTETYDFDQSSSQEVLAGLVEGFVMESSYNMKPPCYGHETINPVDDPTCMHGNQWTVEVTQATMGGDFGNPNIIVRNDDNFHRVQSIAPVHLPYISNTCDINTTETCYLDTVTISENKYDFLDELDTGYYPTSASEIKTKLSSRQEVQTMAGVVDPDFHEDDEVGNRCADINQKSIEWGLSKASAAAIENYNNYGVKFVVGDDKGPYNEGPLWIWTFMSYKESDDHMTMSVQAPMMRTPTDYFIGSAAGFHYCKVLSPFRVLEHIYNDSLYEKNGINTDSFEEELEQLSEGLDELKDLFAHVIEDMPVYSAATFLN